MNSNTLDKNRLSSLKNQFLIAMPSLNQSFFSHTITLMCNHDKEGALGLVINQPLDIELSEIFSQLEVDSPHSAAHAKAPVMCGGPVQSGRGFVLHSTEKSWDSTLPVSKDISLTASQDVIHAIAKGEGPEKFLVILGYAGWDDGQLEDEISDNAWLTAPANAKIIFDTPPEQRWSAAAKNLGIDFDLIPGTPGHA